MRIGTTIATTTSTTSTATTSIEHTSSKEILLSQEKQHLPSLSSNALDDDEEEMFNFGYAVKDEAQGDDFSHQVSSDGDNTTGEYRVALPDGRIQVSQLENSCCYIQLSHSQLYLLISDSALHCR